MNTLSKASIVLLIVLLSGIDFLFGKLVGGHAREGLTKLTKADMETIFKDAPPMALKRLAEDPELKKKQIEEIKQFLAVAEEACESDLLIKKKSKMTLKKFG